MILVLFLGALVFFIYPAVSKRNISFIDLYILYCLYFDATVVLAGAQMTNYIYVQYFLVLLFSVYYYTVKVKHFTTFDRKLFISIAAFILILLVIPIFKGAGINETVRSVSVHFTSLIILPVSFHYYSNRGSIKNLIFSGYLFIISWILIVVLFTVFRVDFIQPTFRGDRLHSIAHGGGIFYFGMMAFRGGVTYISFALLLIPLIILHSRRLRKFATYVSAGFIISVLLVALKRFSFTVILLGFFNYFIKLNIRTKIKVRIFIGTASLIILIFTFTDLLSIVDQRYWDRGGEAKFSQEAVADDLRIFEPIYVLQSIIKGSVNDFLFGPQLDRVFAVDSERHFIAERHIHNQYGQFMLMYGLLGLFVYLYIFLVLYRFTLSFYRRLQDLKIDVHEYWIVFQNLVLIFLVAGMVGGHIHVTFRGLVFLFAGGISGYFYKTLKHEL
jgi:hypothetical protein